METNHNRVKLNGKDSIPAVINGMTLEEKVSMLSAVSACMTKAIPELDIPMIRLYDGVTGVNSSQIVLDYMYSHPNLDGFDWPQAMEIASGPLDVLREKHKNNSTLMDVIAFTEILRPNDKDFLCLPSGVNIGASWNVDTAEKIGQASGWEMRNSHVDICLGPNVDIMRDPLGGRNYEMYGEDPCLVGKMAAGFIRGMQGTGVGACAKHFIANNQESRRQEVNTHVSERTLREIYSPGFVKAVQDAKVKTVMSAYCSVSGAFASYNKTLLTDWLKEEWGFKGVVVSDWGAVHGEKNKAIEAGLDLILTGPNDLSECIRAVEEGTLPEAELDDHVARILGLICDLKAEQASIPEQYDVDAILQTAHDAITDGAVLLKNEQAVLPLRDAKKIAFWGKGSKTMLECGSGSTAVNTMLHSNVFDEMTKLLGTESVVFEKWDDADTLVYTVTAQGGEGADREAMDIDGKDREQLPGVLKEAKARGMNTVVVLNVSGPVDVRTWIADADAALCVFIPGYMGGKATADLLLGNAFPGGRLPMTFPVRYEDAPAYPNFPGEHTDVYYGEGLFIGYRSYEKRKVPVQFPFGFGLNFTSFAQSTSVEEIRVDLREEHEVHIPVRVQNTGHTAGSQVIQLYVAECKPRLLRPEKELKAFAKVTLAAGEAAELNVVLKTEDLACFDPKIKAWVVPTGQYRLYLGTSVQDVFAEIPMCVQGENPYAIGRDTLLAEVLNNPKATEILEQYLPGICGNEMINLISNRKMGEAIPMIAIMYIPNAAKMDAMLDEMYQKLAEID